MDEQKKDTGLEDVVSVAEYAYETVPLYTELAEKYHIDKIDFFNLPIVSKETYMESEAPYFSLQCIEKYLTGELIHGKTSGSTGKVTDYYWDPDDEKMSLMELWYYRKKYYDINPDDKLCYFFPIFAEGKDYIRTERFLGLSKSFLYNARLEEAYKQMLEYKPKWLILQPSVAWLLCQAIKSSGLPVLDSVEYIEFTGEYLENNIRKMAEEVFHCKTANQYGIREANSIAYECPFGHMHVMRKNAYVEILNPVDRVGDICITSLKNKAMPYIRYNTGDKGKLWKCDCPCGNKNEILDVCNGRSNDWVRKTNGELLHPYSLLQVMNEINMVMQDCVIQYQLIQQKTDYFMFRLVVKEGTNCGELEKNLCGLTAERLQQGFQVEFRYYEQLLPDEETGKIAAFRCEIEEEGVYELY